MVEHCTGTARPCVDERPAIRWSSQGPSVARDSARLLPLLPRRPERRNRSTKPEKTRLLGSPESLSVRNINITTSQRTMTTNLKTTDVQLPPKVILRIMLSSMLNHHYFVLHCIPEYILYLNIGKVFEENAPRSTLARSMAQINA